MESAEPPPACRSSAPSVSWEARKARRALDRRGVLVELTKAGHEAWEKALGAQAEKESLLAAALTKDEQRQLNALLRRMMREFERREEAPS